MIPDIGFLIAIIGIVYCCKTLFPDKGDGVPNFGNVMAIIGLIAIGFITYDLYQNAKTTTEQLSETQARLERIQTLYGD